MNHYHFRPFRPAQLARAQGTADHERTAIASMARNSAPMAFGSVMLAWCLSLTGGKAPRRSPDGSRSARPVATA